MALVTTPKECPEARALFDSMEHHLFIAACFDGYHRARLHIDSLQQPRAAFLWLGQRGYLAGDPYAESFQETLSAVILHEMPSAIRIYCPDDEWMSFLQESILPDRHAKRLFRQYYTCTPDAREYSRWLNDEIGISWLGMQLLGQEMSIENHQLIEDAIVASNPSYDDFLEKGWGICALHVILGHGNYAGWCLAENVVNDRCEIGIEVLPSFRRRGIATAMINQFVSTAHEIGFRHIGWHCWKDNRASASTALRAGFQLESEYPVLTMG